MYARQRKLVESYQRVRTFLTANPAPNAPGLSQVVATFDVALAELADHSSAVLSGGQLSRFERRRLEALMKKLREQHMRPIVAIAKAEIDAQPGITEALRMPNGALGAVALIAAARAMHSSAMQFRETFLRAGRPEDFLEQLTAAVEAVQGAMTGQARNIGTKVGARAGLSKALQRARRAVEIMNPLICTAFEGNEVVLAQWKAAKRVRAVPVPSAEEQPVSPDASPVSPLVQLPPAAA